MNKIGIPSTVKDEGWRRRLRWSLATTGKFSGLRMEPGTSYDFLSHIRNRLYRLASARWHSCCVGCRHQIEVRSCLIEP